jgi:DNA-binding transcriptional ArsR family regulator
MVIYSPNALNLVFGALANPTRRAILKTLSVADKSVLDLVSLFDISQPGITKHLNILERAGMIRRKKAGRYRFCRLIPDPLDGASEWADSIRKRWEEQLDVLDEYLEDLQDKEEIE